MPYGKNRHGVDKRVARTKKAIRTALFEIAETKDIASITVSELSRKAGVNRRTFYTHYTSITDIVNEIEGELVEALRGIVLNFRDNNFRECIYGVFIKLNELVSFDFDYYFRHLRFDMEGAFVERVSEIIDELAGKIVKSVGDISFEKARFAATYAVGGFITVFFEWKNKKIPTLEEAATYASFAAEESIKGVVLNKVG